MVFVCLIILLLSILGQNGGLLHPETEMYLPYYLSEKPLPNILYDSKVLDMDMFQARELSYFFDYLDCKFIQFSVNAGYPHLLSITNYVFVFLMVIMLYRFSTRDLKINSNWAIGLGVLFLTAPYIFLSGNIFRSAKIGVALIVVYVFILIYRLLYGLELLSWVTQMRLLAALFMGMLFDRQGLFLAVLGLVFVFLWIMFKDKTKTALVLPFIASVVLDLLYSYLFAPWLTHYLNGYYPNFEYQKLPLLVFITFPQFFIPQAISLFVDTIRYLLGNIPYLIMFSLLLALLGYLIFKKDHVTVVLLGATSLMVILMIALMVLRHPLLVFIRNVYYWIPTGALFFCFILVGVQRLKSIPAVPSFLIPLLIVACIVGNCLALPNHYQSAFAGESIVNSSSFYVKGQKVIRMLANETYYEELSNNPVYLTLHQ